MAKILWNAFPIICNISFNQHQFHWNKKRYAFWFKEEKMSMRLLVLSLVCFLAFSLGSCSVVEGIFKAGMVWGIFLVVGFIALIIFIIAKVSGGRK